MKKKHEKMPNRQQRVFKFTPFETKPILALSNWRDSVPLN
jgi:hypothetical protein